MFAGEREGGLRRVGDLSLVFHHTIKPHSRDQPIHPQATAARTSSSSATACARFVFLVGAGGLGARRIENSNRNI